MRKMNKTSERETAIFLAREGLRLYLKKGENLVPPEEMPPLFYTKRGAFVSIKTQGSQLKGCIGTLEPTQGNLALEIINNAISAGTSDPRFEPVPPTELDQLYFSVDIISPLEKISKRSYLNPSEYGIVVEKGFRRGVLLPDLEGIDTVNRQISIAAQKAGLSSQDEGITIYRFEVTRFAETPK